MRYFLFLLWLLSVSFSGWAQSPVHIGLITSQAKESKLEDQFTGSVRNEIRQLLQHRRQVQFHVYKGTDFQQSFTQAYAENDIVVGIGTESSGYAISLNSYPKPTIASVIIDPTLQGVQKDSSGASGIHNFTYLESPFNIQRDINLLYEIYPYDHFFCFNAFGCVQKPVKARMLSHEYANMLKQSTEQT